MRVHFDAELGRVWFKCPGCGWTHSLNVDSAKGRPAWSFNGDIHRPTLSPSINAWREYGDKTRVTQRCHSFVRDGQIQFLGDCTHELAGKTVNLPFIEQETSE